jgi:transposase
MNSGGLIMEHITGESRDQIVLIQETIEEMIEETNPVRIIDQYVNKLNLRELRFNLKESGMGRSSYNAALLLKIYIYGYYIRVRSTRRLEEECKRNTEMIWLTCRLVPDFKTLADFRRDNKAAISRLFKEFTKKCFELGLISFEIVATDGTKIGAQNSMGNIYKRHEMDKMEKKIDETIKNYIAELDKNDRSEHNDLKILTENIEKKLSNLKTRKEKMEAIKTMFDEDPELETIYGNDPDSRIGKDKGKADVLYNAQIAVDAKNKLIVAAEITNENNDVHQAGNMVLNVEETKKELKISPELKTVHVMDAGYYCEKEILPLDDAKYNIYIPSPRDEKERKDKYKGKQKEHIPAKGYLAENFKFDKDKNQLLCPEGKRLNNESAYLDSVTGITVGEFKCRHKDCKNKHLCTQSKDGRTVKISLRKEDMDKFDEKVRSDLGRKIVSKRKELAEHPFGTMKRNFGFTYFLTKSYENVKSEFSFTAFMYNFKRVLNILEFDQLKAAF